MKRLLTLLISCVALAHAHGADAPAGTELTRDEAAKVVTYDLDKLQDIGPTLGGKIVRLKFNYRDTDVKKNEDGSMSGTLRIWVSSSRTTNGVYKSGMLDVTVPADGVEWFLKQPSKESRASLLIYARMSEDGKKAKLLGREIRTDLKGPKIIW